MKISIRDLVSYVLIASIFITGEGVVDIGFKLYWYYPLYLLFIGYGFLKFKRVDVKILLVLTAVVLYSFLTFKISFPLVLKQTINLCISTLVFYFFLSHEKFDFNELFRKYSAFAKIVLIIGFLQVFLFLIDAGELFMFLFPWEKSYDVSFRLQSVTQEPSFFALTMAPILFFSLHNIFYRSNYFFNRRWSYLFALGNLMTFSSLAYFTMLLILLILYFKNFSYTKLMLSSFAFGGIAIIGVIAYYSVPSIKLRVDDTFVAFSNDFFETDTYRQVNPSTYAIASNYYVATKAFEEHPLTGFGLGTYESIYDKFIPEKIYDRPASYFRINRQDGAAMALRLLSETGLIGLSLFLVFTLAYKITSHGSFSQSLDLLWCLNTGIFVLIVLVVLRNGNYTAHGRILFLLVYYYTCLASKFQLISRAKLASEQQ